MAQVGQRKHGEIIIRCPECGDSSKSQTKAHFYVNVIKGVGHCMKCGYSPVLSPKQLFEIYNTYGMEIEATYEREESSIVAQISPGPGSPRFSALDRFHYEEDGILYDAFVSRRPSSPGDINGVYLRGPNKFSRMEGKKLIAWPGNSLVSSEDDPIIVVEGPYDVRGDRYSCVFGLIAKRSLQNYASHHVILMPDGDIWEDQIKWRSLLRLALDSGYKFLGPIVHEVWYIRDGKDPDEATNSDVRSFNRRKIASLLR